MSRKGLFRLSFFRQVSSRPPSYRQSSRFYCFVLFLESVGVRKYRCVAVESQLEALCFVRSPRTTRASRVTSPRPSELMALGLAKSRQSRYVSGFSLSREPPKLQQA